MIRGCLIFVVWLTVVATIVIVSSFVELCSTFSPIPSLGVGEDH